MGCGLWASCGSLAEEAVEALGNCCVNEMEILDVTSQLLSLTTK